MLKKQRNRYEQEAGSAEAILQQKEPEAAAVAERPQIASNLIEGSKLFSNLTQLRQRRGWEERLRKGRNREGKKETVCKTEKVLKI